jgi:hypothetical protein
MSVMNVQESKQLYSVSHSSYSSFSTSLVADSSLAKELEFQELFVLHLLLISTFSVFICCFPYHHDFLSDFG